MFVQAVCLCVCWASHGTVVSSHSPKTFGVSVVVCLCVVLCWTGRVYLDRQQLSAKALNNIHWVLKNSGLCVF